MSAWGSNDAPGRLPHPRNRRRAGGRAEARAIFARAIGRGEIAPGLDLEVALDLIYGPLYHRLLPGHAPLDDAFVKSAIDLALRGIESSAKPE